LPISYLHVFTYSERPNTEAIDLPDPVPMKIRNKRSKMLRGLSVKKRRAFYESQIGKELTVLLEGENKHGLMYGFTENYVKVQTAYDPLLVNTTHRVIMTGIDENGHVGIDFCSEIKVG